MVIEQSDKSLLTPKVKVFFSARSRVPIPLEVVDLSAPRCTESIEAREAREDWNFKDLDSLWREQ